jgi:hypothetical protein
MGLEGLKTRADVWYRSICTLILRCINGMEWYVMHRMELK